MIVEPIPKDDDIELLAGRVFLKSIDLLGGLHKLAEYRALTWLPSLARASFVIVLREELMKTEDEIARFLGLTRNTVRNILRADAELAMKRLQEMEEEMSQEGEKKELKVHIAGAFAKLAFKEIKEGKEAALLKKFVGETLKKFVGELLQQFTGETEQTTEPSTPSEI
jgi:probable regulatory domain-containing protein